ETDTIQVKQLLTFDQISKVTGVEKEMLQFLNPAFKLDIIPFVEDEKYSLRLPKPASGKFVSNESAIYDFAENQIVEEKKELPKYVETKDRIRYRVRSGDYLGKIAEKYGVGVSSLRRWNNMRGNNIRIGQYLTIYPNKPVEVVSNNSSSKSSSGSNQKLYTVKQGDSLWSISKKFPGVSVQNLRSWNDMNTNSLKPGMKLKVSKS
ncbi:MAG TPA: LysM peptidoglycan-binding domain-containing protein, partial [Christiangramia sp.]|nr:LysM peptidoglycan-binding domain-containing protein [Christiangramia sp.]